MTNLFGINVTADRKNVEYDETPLVRAKISTGLEGALDQAIREDEEIEERRSLPLSLSVLRWICQLAVLAAAVAVAGAFANKASSFGEIYHARPWLFWLAGVCAIFWVLLKIIEISRKNSVPEHEIDAFERTEDEVRQSVRKELEIPDDAVQMDVLAEQYALKDGEPKHKGFVFGDYLNVQVDAFVRGSNLCLADSERRWEIPLSAFTSLSFSKKKTILPRWNKEEPFDSETYRAFDLRTNQYGQLFARVYRAEFKTSEEEHYLLIPEYDAGQFKALTRLEPLNE